MYMLHVRKCMLEKGKPLTSAITSQAMRSNKPAFMITYYFGLYAVRH